MKSGQRGVAGIYKSGLAKTRHSGGGCEGLFRFDAVVADGIRLEAATDCL